MTNMDVKLIVLRFPDSDYLFDIFKLFNNIINYTVIREECDNSGNNFWLALEKYTVLVEINLAFCSSYNVRYAWC
jgi:hypothetical protein